MPNYLTRKKTLMGKRFEVEVPLEQYGGDIVRVHAIPDMELARIEDRTGYKLEDALAALSSQALTEEEIEQPRGPEGRIHADGTAGPLDKQRPPKH